MYNAQLLLFFMICGFYTHAQSLIRGKVIDNRGDPVSLVNVYLKELLEGSITKEDGEFSFETAATGQIVLVVSKLGYERKEILLNLSKLSGPVEIIVKKTNIQVSTVTITAGAFEASDEKKGALLKPLDIVQNAGAQADIYGALQTLPGVSPTTTETGIFVRGGGAYETKTMMDRMVVPQPFFSNVPNIPARGRFDPFLFKGTLFSTGGYSAEYGQALSSVLLLNTQDMPERTSSSLGLNLVGMEASHTHLWNKKTALFSRLGFTYLRPFFEITEQNRNWIKPPRGFDVALGGRHKTTTGMFKSYFQHQSGNLSLGIENLENPENSHLFQNTNHNTFWNSTYQGLLGTSWSIFTGFAVSHDVDRDQFDQFSTDEDQTWVQSRITLGRDLNKKVYLKMGSEMSFQRNQFYKGFDTGSFESLTRGLFSAFYVESDIKINDQLALRVGGRGEYAEMIHELNLAPRLSMAMKTGKNSQISWAYGTFYQTPEIDILYSTQALNFEAAQHYLMNYQWLTDQYTFRIEAYYKDYRNLVTSTGNFTYNNGGEGVARGIDLFWRDKQTVKHLDYWVTYSLIDSERSFREFTSTVTPPFVSRHTINVVGNYDVTDINLSFGASYTFASGRTFTNPDLPGQLNDQTQDYHNLNINTSYLTSLWNNFTVIYASVQNPLGFDQVFGYTYSADGTMRRAINPPAARTFFVGVFVSFY